MTKDARIARLTELARQVWPDMSPDEVRVEAHENPTTGEVDAVIVCGAYYGLPEHPRALDALHAALLVLRGGATHEIAKVAFHLHTGINALAKEWEDASSAGWPDSDERNLLIEHAIALRKLLETP